MSKVIGIDVGGTFTDLVFFDEGTRTCRVAKVSSTPANQAEGVLTGIASLGEGLPSVDAIVHGTTVATNALLERKGARLALVTTRGFRDVLEMHTRERPFLYGLKGVYRPLVPRDLRFEVTERTDATGRVLVDLDRAELRDLAQRLRATDVDCVVVSFLHSYANPENERRARAVLEETFSPDALVLSSEVLSEVKEFERTSTAVINAYVQPLIGRYFNRLQERLHPAGYERDVLIVQSNGGLIASGIAARAAVNTILSGPAAGVIAGSYIASKAGFDNCITCDMGGTSFDVCLVPGAHPAMTTQTKLGYGLPIGISMIDITTIGAGGGSLAHLDARGILAVGPESAGAIPGPACYGRGGERPTVTDANLLLGRLNAGRSGGTQGGFRLDPALAERAVATLATELGLGVMETAHAIITVANRLMSASIRMVSVERGYDPREFALVVFGGAGPLHAVPLMRELGMAKVIVPYYPGLGCALGCVIADLRHDFSNFIDRSLSVLTSAELERTFAEHTQEGRELLQREDVDLSGVAVVREADMAYEGQLHNVRVRLPDGPLDGVTVRRAFDESYRISYGRLLDGLGVQVVSLRTSVIGLRPKIDLRDLVRPAGASLEAAQRGERDVFFGGKMLRTPIYERHVIPRGASFVGPTVVESDDATVLVEPGAEATVDEFGNLLLEDLR
jgi:N-methylhydantoinase A